MAQAKTARVFRQSALDRLSSPEELDRVITLSRPRDWLAALAFVMLLATGLAWSAWGSVPTRVKGSGLFIATQGRVQDAVAAGEGTVMALLAAVGSEVRQGDVIARIEQQELRQTLANAEAVVEEREAQSRTLTEQIGQNRTARAESLKVRQSMLGLRAKDAEARATAIEREVGKEEDMFQRRLITWQKLSDSRQQLAIARQTVLEARSLASQAESEEIAAHDINQRDVRNSAERLADARRRVAEIQVQIRQREQIRSPADGRVTEWKIAPGARVTTGTPLLSIESGVSGLELLLYLPPDQGKRVAAGMDVRVSPSTVRREEFGTIIGTVKDVSDFPSTPQAMLATVQNDKLVAQLSPKGPPFASHVQLATSPDSASGYRWSGGVGPNVQITSGTLADAEVTVAERSPISYVVPWLKKTVGLDH